MITKNIILMMLMVVIYMKNTIAGEYDYMSVFGANNNQGYYYPSISQMLYTPGVGEGYFSGVVGGSGGGIGSNGVSNSGTNTHMTTYLAMSANDNQPDMKSYAAQSQDYTSGNYFQNEQLSGAESQPSATTTYNSLNSHHHLPISNVVSNYGTQSVDNNNQIHTGTSGEYSNNGYTPRGRYQQNSFRSLVYDNSLANQQYQLGQGLSDSESTTTGMHEISQQTTNQGHHYGSGTSAGNSASSGGSTIAANFNYDQMQSFFNQPKQVESITPVIRQPTATTITQSQPTTATKQQHTTVPVFKQIHIPYQKQPVKVQISHPIYLPISQTYPVHLPITKPVAVPYYQEITIPIEKLLPLTMDKKIQYSGEKHIPYTYEKHITVPVIQPYPVKMPLLKTILHKVKSHGWH